MDMRQVASRARLSTATVSRTINRIPTVDPQFAKRMEGCGRPWVLPQLRRALAWLRPQTCLWPHRFGDNKSVFPLGSFRHVKVLPFSITTKFCLLPWPSKEEVVIQLLGQIVGSRSLQTVALLGGNAKLQFDHRGDGLHVDLPSQPPTKYAYMLRMTF